MFETFKTSRLRWALQALGLWLWANPMVILIGAGILVAFLFVMLVASQIQSCNSRKAQEKDANNQVQIIEGNANLRVLESQGNAVNANVKATNANSKQAEVNQNRAAEKPSTQSESNFKLVKPKFCREFPADPRCK